MENSEDLEDKDSPIPTIPLPNLASPKKPAAKATPVQTPSFLERSVYWALGVKAAANEPSLEDEEDAASENEGETYEDGEKENGEKEKESCEWSKEEDRVATAKEQIPNFKAFLGIFAQKDPSKMTLALLITFATWNGIKINEDEDTPDSELFGTCSRVLAQTVDYWNNIRSSAKEFETKFSELVGAASGTSPLKNDICSEDTVGAFHVRVFQIRYACFVAFEKKIIREEGSYGIIKKERLLEALRKGFNVKLPDRTLKGDIVNALRRAVDNPWAYQCRKAVYYAHA